MAQLRGQCKCGKTRFELKDEPLFLHACHCEKCQGNSDLEFGITLFVLEEDINIVVGSLLTEPFFTEHKQNTPHRFTHSCRHCGNRIFTTAENHPATALLNHQLIEDPSKITIDAHIFVNRKLASLELAKDALQFETFYDRDEAWPKKSLTRLASAVERASKAPNQD